MKKMSYWFIPIVILMIIGTFFDFQISTWQTSVNESFIIHSFYRFFEIFGEFAFIFVFVLFFGFFTNFGYRKGSKAIKWVQTILNGIALYFFSVIQFLAFIRYLNPEDPRFFSPDTPTILYVVSILLGVVLAIIVFKLMDNIKIENYKYFRRVAIMSLVYLIVLTFVINGIKIVWARPRYWAIVGGQATYVPWYVINGNHITEVTNAFKSFPSGHTANAFAALTMSLWFVKRRDFVFGIFMIWGLLTAVSRIFAGQHFLTDTIMGGAIAFVLFLIFVKLFKLDNTNELV